MRTVRKKVDLGKRKMDERTRYNKVCRILKPIVGETVHLNKLWSRIIIEIGSTESVVRDSFRLMVSLGLIVEVKPFMFKILRCEADI